jgi:hypothetical protein
MSDLITWDCKVGEIPREHLHERHPHGDTPMRAAIAKAYLELTGREPDFLFSGWGGKLDEGERAVVEDREPHVLPAKPVLLDRLIAVMEYYGRNDRSKEQREKDLVDIGLPPVSIRAIGDYYAARGDTEKPSALGLARLLGGISIGLHLARVEAHDMPCPDLPDKHEGAA